MSTPTAESRVAEVDATDLADLLRRADAASSDLRAALAVRLGIPTNSPLAVLLDRLDRALDRVEPPEGSVLVDSDRLADLERDAEDGRVSRHQRLVSDAVTRGKITPAGRANWLLLLETDPGAEQALARIKPNTAVPVAPLGYGGDRETERDLYAEVFGT